jgi:hypothetical protein
VKKTAKGAVFLSWRPGGPEKKGQRRGRKMADRENREQEYLRRMRALGYEPSLMGMDDEDIEWELQRMDGGREETRPAHMR